MLFSLLILYELIEYYYLSTSAALSACILRISSFLSLSSTLSNFISSASFANLSFSFASFLISSSICNVSSVSISFTLGIFLFLLKLSSISFSRKISVRGFLGKIDPYWVIKLCLLEFSFEISNPNSLSFTWIIQQQKLIFLNYIKSLKCYI